MVPLCFFVKRIFETTSWRTASPDVQTLANAL